jgi:hypothetical protein
MSNLYFSAKNLVKQERSQWTDQQTRRVVSRRVRNLLLDSRTRDPLTGVGRARDTFLHKVMESWRVSNDTTVVFESRPEACSQSLDGWDRSRKFGGKGAIRPAERLSRLGNIVIDSLEPAQWIKRGQARRDE